MESELLLDFSVQRKGFSLVGKLALPLRGVSVFYGPSGCGKTTVLRMIAGLDKIPGTQLSLHGNIWQGSNQWVPPHLRQVGYVSQDSNLFPHLSVEENLRFGLNRRMDASESLMTRAIELLGISQLLKRKPEGLSGGEKQRVAMARALASGPKILLFDEPLASLDQSKKREILPFLETLHRELEIPMIYVTHSPEEMTRLGDYLVVFGSGRIPAQGPLKEVLAGEFSPFRLTEEEGVVLQGEVISRDGQWNLSQIQFPGGQISVRDPGIPEGGLVRIRILARDVSLSREGSISTSIINNLVGFVEEICGEEHPALALVKIRVGEAAVLARVTRMALQRLEIGTHTQVQVHIKSAACIV